MKAAIVGTAGHIDHGKTALVKALTGIDADRLEEEKRRGITIDLGFAHTELPGPNGETLRLGFVDVPGHERFVRNMLAGVGGIDLVLLVIAADEGIKPQTREHFDICRLLSVRRGITVLTKSDLVDEETLGTVRLEVEEFVRGSFLKAAPVIPASSLTGAGVGELKRAIADAVAQAPARDSASLARLPIDRVFSMKGFGTVVTGTLLSGRVKKEDELEVFPNGRRARVRGVQVHGQPAAEAVAGQRTALNLAGVDKADLERGMALAAPGTFNSTVRADALLTLLPSVKALKNRARTHLHVHSSETIAEVVLLERKPLSPGKTAVAQLRLAEPLLLLPGDRFIVRQFSPVTTIGGGVVLDASPLPKTRSKATGAFLDVLANGDPPTVLKARIARRESSGLSLAQAVAETGWRREEIFAHLSGALEKGEVARSGDLFFAAAEIERLKQALLQALRKFHAGNPLVPSQGKEALREGLKAGPEVFEAVLSALAREHKVETSGDSVRLAGHRIAMKDEEAESRQAIETTFASAGLKVPALNDVLAGLKVDKARAQKIITLLLRDKVLIKISDDLVFHRLALEDLRRRVVAEKAKSSKIDVARFKDLAGVSRKYAIPLLEYLDRERVTRRVGDVRVIL